MLRLIIEGWVEGKGYKRKPRLEYMQQIMKDQRCNSYVEIKNWSVKNTVKLLFSIKLSTSLIDFLVSVLQGLFKGWFQLDIFQKKMSILFLKISNTTRIT